MLLSSLSVMAKLPMRWQAVTRHWHWLSWLIFSVAAFAAPIDDEGEVYFVDVLSYGYRLGEGVPIYLYKNSEYLQLELLLEYLEFPITVHDDLWQGWFIHQDNTFRLDTDRALVSFPGHENTETAPDAYYHSVDGLVIRREYLEQWFSLQLELDLRQQVVNIRSQQALPFQQQLEQEAKLNRGSRYLEPEVGKPVADQYQWFTEPQMDISSAAEYFENGQVNGNSVFLSLNASMDVLKHGMHYSGSLSSNRANNINIATDSSAATAEKNDALQSTFGNHTISFFRRANHKAEDIILGIDFYEFGDIFGTSNLVSGGGSGLGFNLGRNQKNSQAALGKTTIAGIAPANWLAELYRDGVLLDIGRVEGDGQYRFPDRELNYGQNLFLVRLEGPQGEVIEHRYPIWGGGSDLAAGEHNFDFLYIDHRQKVFDEVQGDHTALPATRTIDSTVSLGLAAQTQMGVGFTLIEHYARADSGDTSGTPSSPQTTQVDEFYLLEDQYLTLSAQTNVGIGTLSLAGVQQENAGGTWKLGFLGKHWGQNIYFDHQQFDNFTSPANRGRENIADQSELKIEAPFSWRGLNSYSIGVVHKSFIDDRQNYEIRQRLGGHWQWLDLNNELAIQRNDRSVNYQGRLRFSTRVANSSLRGEISYAPGRKQFWQRMALDWTHKFNHRVSNNLKVIQSLKDDKDVSVKNRVTWRFPSIDLGFDLSWNDSNYSIGLNVNTAFGYDRHASRFFRSRTGLSNTGKVALQLFVDSNNNGQLDTNEETLEDVYYRNEDLVSGKVGGLLLNRVPEKNIINIKTDDLVFNDGYLVPVEPRYAVYTHAGSTVSLPIPVVVTGDIEGMVYRLDTNGKQTYRGKMGVELELKSENGRVVRTVRSQYDGYYSFVEIPIGRYQLRVVGKYADPALVWDLELNDEEGYVEMDDFYVY